MPSVTTMVRAYKVQEAFSRNEAAARARSLHNLLMDLRARDHADERASEEQPREELKKVA